MSLALRRCKWIGFSLCLVLAASSCSSDSSPSEDAPPREEPSEPGGDEPGPASAGEGGGSGVDTPKGEGGASGGQPGTSPDPDEGQGGEDGEDEEPAPSNGGASSGDAGAPSASGGRETEPEAGGRAGASSEGGSDARGGAPSTEPSPEVLRGAELAETNLCAACHQADYSGLGFYPNITPDMESGIGGWSDAQIVSALKLGTDANGGTLCSLMPRLSTMNDADLGAIVAFLRSLPAVSNVVVAQCPGQ